MATTATLLDKLTPLSDDLHSIKLLGHHVCRITGVSYRQLNYWTDTGLIHASIRPGQGSGHYRLYGYRDVLETQIIATLLGMGINLQKVRTILPRTRRISLSKLMQSTLVIYGDKVVVCTTPQQITTTLTKQPHVLCLSMPPLISGININDTSSPAA